MCRIEHPAGGAEVFSSDFVVHSSHGRSPNPVLCICWQGGQLFAIAFSRRSRCYSSLYVLACKKVACVICVCVLRRGHVGVACVSSEILCRYSVISAYLVCCQFSWDSSCVSGIVILRLVKVD